MSFNLATILTETALAAPELAGLPYQRNQDDLPRA